MDEAWQPTPDLSPALALRRLILGHRVTQVIATAAQLGLADHLTDIPKSAAELAPLVHAEVRALYRFLRALASIGVVVANPAKTSSIFRTFGEPGLERPLWGA